MAFYGSYLPIEETVDMFSKHLGITLKKAESTILGIGYHYS
jgi:hypothetical protein